MSKISKEIAERADRLYEGRERIEEVRLSLEMLGGAPDDYEALWRMARAHFFLGQEEVHKERAREHHLSGVDSGKRAVRAFESGVEGRFWLGVNLALLAGLAGPLVALPYALGAKRELQRAAHLDPAYHGAGPLRVLARLESRLPRIMGGGKGRARMHYEEALSLAPENTVTRIYFAELLLECGDPGAARLELEALLAIPFNRSWAFEIKRDRARALELMRKMGWETRG